MSFRTKVLATISLTIIVTVWLVAYFISARITRLYEQREAQRASNLIRDFHKQLASRGAEIAASLTAIANSTAISHLATSLADPAFDAAAFVNDAEAIAREHSLPLLGIVAPDGAIISSAHWSARFGYHEDWLLSTYDWNATPPFLKYEELPDGPVLAMMAVRSIRSGDKQFFVAGGASLEQHLIQSLSLPEGMRVAVWREKDDPRSLTPSLLKLATSVRDSGREETRLVITTSGEEVASAIPLTGYDKQVRAVVLAIQNRSELAGLKRGVQRVALFVGGGAVLVAIAVTFWSASLVTKPVKDLATSVRQVADGDWTTRAKPTSNDEIGQLARDFNFMTEQLVSQRDRMLQAERVAAWREIARRLAHELKNPLFPLQITVETLQRAKTAAPEEFDEIFEESTTTLLAELTNLKTIIGRFGDFARMPAPQFEDVNVNETVREAAGLFQSIAVKPALELAPDLPTIKADPEQLRRALRNLMLNAMDAMPKGGRVTLRTNAIKDTVIIEVADTGEGLTPEEQARLFTPYYTTKQHGTGLGLAIVQSVVSDHGGKISVESEPGRGTTFRIELKA